jgi:hypothetical protein
MQDINKKLIHIHQGLVLCPFASNFPYQLIPLLKLCSLIFDLTFFDWFISIYLSLFRHVRKIMKSDSFIMSLSICPSVHMEQLSFLWTDFHEIWYSNIIWKFVKRIQVSLKSDKNNRYFTWRPTHISDNNLLSSS